VLNVGDEIFAGDFKGRILSNTGDGSMTGKAAIKIPYLADAEIEATFTNVAFNECYELQAGAENKIVSVYDSTRSGILNIDEIIDGLEYQFLQQQISNALDRLEVYEGSETDKEDCRRIYNNIVKVRAKIAASSKFPEDLKQLYLTQIDKALADFGCALDGTATTENIQDPASKSGRVADNPKCSVKYIKAIFTEVGKALTNPWGYIISKGGDCLRGFAFELAGQYVINYGIRSITGKPTDFATIYREDINIMDAVGACGSSVLASITGKEDGIGDLVINAMVGMADDIKKQYIDEQKELNNIDINRALGSAAYAAVAQIVGKYTVEPVVKSIGKYGYSLIRKVFEDKLRVPKWVCDNIFQGRLCFLAGTPVRLPYNQGTLPIEAITDTTWVLSRDLATGKEEARRVKTTFVNTTHKLVKVFSGTDIIITTPDHPFYVNEHRHFTEARYLQKGYHLSTAQQPQANLGAMPYLARASVEIDSIAFIDSTAKVYNFEVDEFHTYFVGNQSIWVHNSSPCSPKALIPNGPNGYGELGLVVYRNVRKQVSDNLTGHHIPSVSFMETLQKELLGSNNPRGFTASQIIEINKWKKNDVYTIMIEETKGAEKASRHARTLTYKGKANNSERLKKTPKEIFEEEIQNLYDIYSEDGLLTPDVIRQIDRFKQVMQYKFSSIF
jgi:hypothetical protein